MTEQAVTLNELFDGDDASAADGLRRRRARGSGGGSARRASILLATIACVATLSVNATDHTQVLALKLFALLVLAFLPGWLFLRFVIVRSQSVFNEYVLNLHRLGVDRPGNLPEPPVGSIYHPAWQWARTANPTPPDRETNIYTDKFEAYYGKSIVKSSERRQLKAETFFPVILATVVFAVGWGTVLWNSSFLTLPDFPSTPDLLGVSFAGAYLFTVQMLVRRYFQADLKASAYVNAVIRIVSALMLIAVVHQALMNGWSRGPCVAAAFMIGFFPLVGLQALQKMAAVALRTAVPSLKNDYPLSDLDGLSVWYESRLLELGIEDLENLATANLVDVILHSRVPVGRLVDWVDQATLYLQLEPWGTTDEEHKASSRHRLRRLGIRTATALEAAFRPSPTSPATGSEAEVLVPFVENAELLEQLRWALSDKGSGPSVTQTLLKAFRIAPNLEHVRHWKKDWDIDGHADHGEPGGTPQAPQVPQALAAA
ncbi:MAG: hypothetical protein QOJ69_1711 [Actinomycetota bacterium]|jgi:hypothetical protein|nr:hypothetical protein [Actinomycetota bacterium]